MYLLAVHGVSAKWIVMRSQRASDVRAEADAKLTNLLQLTESKVYF